MSDGHRSGEKTRIHVSLTIPVETVMATLGAIRALEVEANRPPEVVAPRLPHLMVEERLHRRQRQRQRQATKTKGTATTPGRTTATTQAAAKAREGIAE